MKNKLVEKVSEIKNNPWKFAFLLLAGLLLAITLVVSFKAFGEREPDYKPKVSQQTKKEDPSFQVQLKKEQVNQIISFYLNDYLKESGVKYNFYLEQNALLNGTFNVLGFDMQFYLYFDPFVMDDGNVQLKATSLSIGKLALPISQIMKYVSKEFKLPEWVEVSPKKQTITLHLNDFELQNGMYLKEEKINLIDDDIKFNVYLPIEDTKGKE